MIRSACVVAALWLLLPAPANAQLRAVSDGPTPVLAGDRVLWGQRSGDILHFVSAPVSGGPAVPFGDLAMSRRDAVWLAASPALVAVQLRDSGSASAPGACTSPDQTVHSGCWPMTWARSRSTRCGLRSRSRRRASSRRRRCRAAQPARRADG